MASVPLEGRSISIGRPIPDVRPNEPGAINCLKASAHKHRVTTTRLHYLPSRETSSIYAFAPMTPLSQAAMLSTEDAAARARTARDDCCSRERERAGDARHQVMNGVG